MSQDTGGSGADKQSAAAHLSSDVIIPSYLVQSLLSTLCCCPPIGLIALIYSLRVNASLRADNPRRAEEASIRAKQWVITALVAGILTHIVLIALQIVGGVLTRT